MTYNDYIIMIVILIYSTVPDGGELFLQEGQTCNKCSVYRIEDRLQTYSINKQGDKTIMYL